MMYNLLVEQLFFDLRHAGDLPGIEGNRQVFETGTPGQASLIRLTLIADDHGRIRRAGFKAYGNPYLLAAMEYLCRQIEGRQLHDCPSLTWQDLIKLLDIPVTQQAVALLVAGIYQQMLNSLQQQELGKT